ncbi:hypothetical protein CDAR_548431 [Caerostris darwini]|uniref:Uncharacterized protein n=1 Tax=Caerostris darwini TaxID=1538125 RepID=A0AAV4WJH0_9ARAC|nr:hypothetical protein CDAR_548431 [Caerostris darwini]
MNVRPFILFSRMALQKDCNERNAYYALNVLYIQDNGLQPRFWAEALVAFFIRNRCEQELTEGFNSNRDLEWSQIFSVEHLSVPKRLGTRLRATLCRAPETWNNNGSWGERPLSLRGIFSGPCSRDPKSVASWSKEQDIPHRNVQYQSVAEYLPSATRQFLRHGALRNRSL